MSPFSAVVLSGGQSRRMGRNKAWIEFGGGPLIARQLATLRTLGPVEVLISGPAGCGYESLGERVIPDAFPGSGPLAGIERALALAASPLVLVVAVDMPLMTAACLRHLLRRCAGGAGIIPRVAGRLEPLAAVYPRRARVLARRLLSEGQRAVWRFADLCSHRRLADYVDMPSAFTRCFTNWNWPEDVLP